MDVTRISCPGPTRGRFLTPWPVLAGRRARMLAWTVKTGLRVAPKNRAAGPWLQDEIEPVPGGHQPSSSGEGLPLSFLRRLLRFFSRSLLSRSRSGTRVGMRVPGRSFKASRRRLNRARAALLFLNWLRSSRAVTTTPVGRCVNRTPLSVRFWCCPPFPPEVKVSTLHWARRPSSDSGMGTGRRVLFSSVMDENWRIFAGFLWQWMAGGDYLSCSAAQSTGF